MNTRRNCFCYIIGVVLILNLVIAVASIVCVHVDCWGFRESLPLLRMHIMAGLFGMLGATIRTFRRYYKALITEEMGSYATKKSHRITWGYGWFIYYISRPLIGGVLGASIYMLSFLGLQVMIDSNQMQMTLRGCILIYSLAFISGYSASNVMDKVDYIAKKVFSKTNIDGADNV